VPVVTETFPPCPSGMNVAMSGQEIDDTECQYLQDGLLDKPGLARRRGPLQAATGWAALPRAASGLSIAIDPVGDARYAALTGTGAAGYLTVWSSDLSAVTDLSWPHVMPTDPGSGVSSAFRLVNSAPAISGGTWVGTASDYGASSPLHALGLWYGAGKADYTTGTITITRGSSLVTGAGTSWLTNVQPGMFLFSQTDDASAGTFTAAFIGVVLSVNSNTSITLEANSPYSGSAGRTYTLTSLRGFIPKVMKGQITCATDSTTVSGGATKFSSQLLGTGTWNLYRLSDGTWIGKVASVQSDISLTLAANAAIAAADERFVAIRGDWSVAEKSVDITGATNKPGWLTAIYAERQWYANNGGSFDKTYRLWFSDSGDKEGVDLSSDGDWIPISATSDVPEPLRALVPTYNALLALKENEAFAVYGTSPSSFSAKKLEDDGTISSMSVQSYGGGAIWAGRNGIYYYDGVQVQNMTRNKLGDVWKNTVKSIDTLRYRAWSMMLRNHYFLFIEDLDPTISVVKGNTTSTPDHWVVSINMDTQAFSLHTNVKIRGAVTLPAEQGRGVRAVVNNASNVGTVIDADQLFDAEGVDDFAAGGVGTAGPDFYLVTKKYNAGNDVQLKRFKQFAVHYLAQGGAVKVDAVLGLNEVGQTLTSDLPATVLTWDALRTLLPNWSSVSAEYPAWNNLIEGVFRPKRVRFLKKDHHMSFRLWQETSSMTRVKIGPFHIAYKLMRPQRVT